MATTLYGSSTVTTQYTTVVPVVTTIPPYGTVSVITTTYCVGSAGGAQTGACGSYTTETATAIIDYFETQTRTTSLTQVVYLTSTVSFPTATIAGPGGASPGDTTPAPVPGGGSSSPTVTTKPLTTGGNVGTTGSGSGTSSIKVGKIGIALLMVFISSPLIL